MIEMTIKNNKLSERIMLPRLMRAARALAGWEQSDLADTAGISIATVRKIEQGAIGMRLATKKNITDAFKRAGIQWRYPDVK